MTPLHFLDSLLLLAATPIQPGWRVLDVGTGAGFPGLPLAIALPSVECTLIDSTRKKADFVRSTAEALGLENVCTLWGRAEELAASAKHRGRYDLVTARAVAKLDVLAGWLLPFVRPGGIAVACKSRHADAEIAEASRAIEAAGGRVEAIQELTIPETDVMRRLVIIRKAVGRPERRSG